MIDCALIHVKLFYIQCFQAMLKHKLVVYDSLCQCSARLYVIVESLSLVLVARFANGRTSDVRWQWKAFIGFTGWLRSLAMPRDSFWFRLEQPSRGSQLWDGVIGRVRFLVGLFGKFSFAFHRWMSCWIFGCTTSQTIDQNIESYAPDFWRV